MFNMKEMHYTTEQIFNPLYIGLYKGFRYAVVSYGHHPCCYVALESSHPYYGVQYEDIFLFCHGGLTYSHFGLGGFESTCVIFNYPYWVIGWDYAHCGDFIKLPQVSARSKEFGRKWSTEELIIDCKNVIEQLDFMSKIKEKIYA